MKFVFLALLLFPVGCVSRKTALLQSMAAKEAGRIEGLHELAIIEDGRRGAIQRMNEMAVERDAALEKIHRYLALNCKCKHKGVLR